MVSAFGMFIGPNPTIMRYIACHNPLHFSHPVKSAYTYISTPMLVSRRHFFFGSLAMPALATKKPAVERPNVVLILVDNLPSWMLACYGNKEVRSPNIQRLSDTGTRFLNHFAASSLAGPDRSTLLTGRTPMQMGEAGK